MIDSTDKDVKKLIKIVNKLKERKLIITVVGNTSTDAVLIDFNEPETNDDNDRVVCTL